MPLVCDVLTEIMPCLRERARILDVAGFRAVCEQECPAVARMKDFDFVNVLT